jgi:hypothetical protein
MEFQDKTLTCMDCGTEFIWTAGEQLFFADKQLQERAEALQGVQGEAGHPAGRSGGRERVETSDHLLGVRQGHHGAVPPDAGAPGVLQGVLPAAQVRGQLGGV